jgi:hypothetical protein
VRALVVLEDLVAVELVHASRLAQGGGLHGGGEGGEGFPAPPPPPPPPRPQVAYPHAPTNTSRQQVTRGFQSSNMPDGLCFQAQTCSSKKAGSP